MIQPHDKCDDSSAAIPKPAAPSVDVPPIGPNSDAIEQPQAHSEQAAREAFTLKEKLGVGLVGLAMLLQWSVLVVPFVDLETSEKLWLAGALTVAGEIVFWLGVLVAGRDFIRRYRDRISLKKKQA